MGSARATRTGGVKEVMEVEPNREASARRGHIREVPLSGPPWEREVERPIHIPEMFVKGLPRAARKQQGRLSNDIVPAPMVVRQRGLRFEPRRIEAYRRVCEYEAEPGRVPLPYPEIHFTPLMAEAIVSGRFPLSPLGLIHTRQTIALHRPVEPHDVVDLTAALSAIRETPRGYEVDFSLSLERDGALAWSGTTTVLSRAAHARTVRPKGDRDLTSAPPRIATQVRSVRRNTGVAFARVSGDWNPHHLWWFTARPLGYRRPIAHGMWTFARAVTVALRGADPVEPLSATVSFKKPLLLPARIQIEAPRLATDVASVPISVRDARTGAPHVVGDVGR